MTGIITTIQRMSIHDGPGIRSSVFLKGCNFRCKWCHNPETWSFTLQLQYIQSRCIASGTCVKKCKESALVFTSEGINIDRTKCTLCAECTDSCVSGALSIAGKNVEAQEVVKELMQDKLFYDESGGGITLSGGEPLLQILFIKEILQLCKQHNIHSVIESNLSVPTQQIEEIMPYVDLWLVDLKFADDSLHRKWTGASNKQTIKNLHHLCKAKADVIVRTPVIPGANDTPEEITMICEILKNLKIKQYELLPFHPLGFDKFEHLGMENPLAGMMNQKVDSLDELNNVIRNYNLDNNI